MPPIITDKMKWSISKMLCEEPAGVRSVRSVAARARWLKLKRFDCTEFGKYWDMTEETDSMWAPDPDIPMLEVGTKMIHFQEWQAPNGDQYTGMRHDAFSYVDATNGRTQHVAQFARGIVRII